jgi:hypothetical protein
MKPSRSINLKNVVGSISRRPTTLCERYTELLRLRETIKKFSANELNRDTASITGGFNLSCPKRAADLERHPVCGFHPTQQLRYRRKNKMALNAA